MVHGTDSHDNLLRAQTSDGLDIEIEFIWFGVEVVGFIVSGWLLFLRVPTEWPLKLCIILVPECGMSQLVVGIVFEADC